MTKQGFTANQITISGKGESENLVRNLPAGPGNAVMMGTHEYAATNVPSLAIWASPRLTPPFTDPAAIVRFQANDLRNIARYNRIAPVLPKVRFVRIAQADHYIFQSNEAEVLREMRTFITSLPK